jgi:hypothetical protein
MTQPPSAQDIAQLAHALLLGTRKRPLSLPPAAAALLAGNSSLSPAMLALVLSGQHARFMRPPAPTLEAASEADLAVHADPRPMLSDASRRLLKQLLGIAKGDAPEPILLACRDRAGAHGLRLHPFDLPALAPYMRGAQSASPPQGGAGAASLDAATWKTMPQDQRVGALRRLRHASPDAARALLEATFRTETAANRAAFIAVMAIQLSADDLPFLEAAAKDRAETVWTTALRLAGSIPGTNAYRERLDRAAALFAPRGKGKLAETAKLALVKGRSNDEVLQAFEGLRLEDVAERMGCTPADFIERLLPGEDAVPLALIVTAATNGDAGLAVTLIKRLSGPRALATLWVFHPDSLDVPDEARQAIVEALVDLAIAGGFPEPQTLHAYYRILRAPLPERLANKLLASESWRSHVARLAAPDADGKTPNAVKVAVLLIPDSLLGAFLASIQPLSPHLTLPARLFAEFCQSLAQTQPVAPLKPSS